MSLYTPYYARRTLIVSIHSVSEETVRPLLLLKRLNRGHGSFHSFRFRRNGELFIHLDLRIQVGFVSIHSVSEETVSGTKPGTHTVRG